MNFVISILLKVALTVVNDVFGDVNCVKCKSVWYYASFQPSPQSKSKGKNNECLFSTHSM